MALTQDITVNYFQLDELVEAESRWQLNGMP
jgi:hypothetical protein